MTADDRKGARQRRLKTRMVVGLIVAGWMDLVAAVILAHAAWAQTAPAAAPGDPTGAADSAASIQSALASGKALACAAGAYKMASGLLATTPAQHGQAVTGIGPGVGPQGGPGEPGRCTFMPTSAVDAFLTLDGTPNRAWLIGGRWSGLSVDMTAMPAGSAGIKLGQAYDDVISDVRVYGDIAKTALYSGAGNYTTLVQNFAGRNVFMGSNDGIDDPTTLTLLNPDIASITTNFAANLTTIGGAVQPVYHAGRTTIDYMSPGPTNMVGFWPTTQAANAASGITSGLGLYVAVGASFDNLQELLVLGTDFEGTASLPKACAISGAGAYEGPTYDDGTHGCAPIYWVWEIGRHGPVSGCEFQQPTFANSYLWIPNGSACIVTGLNAPGLLGSDWALNMADIHENGAIRLWRSSIQGYSDDGRTNTLLIDPTQHNGRIVAGDLSLNPQANGGDFLTAANAAGSTLLQFRLGAAGQGIAGFGGPAGSVVQGWSPSRTATWRLDDADGAISTNYLGGGAALTVNHESTGSNLLLGEVMCPKGAVSGACGLALGHDPGAKDALVERMTYVGRGSAANAMQFLWWGADVPALTLDAPGAPGPTNRVGVNTAAPAHTLDVRGVANATAYDVGGVSGVSCSGPPTSSFTVTNGLVTHC